jgi:hypothetical protein
MGITESALTRLAAIGAELNNTAPARLAHVDHNSAARRQMTLGATRAAYVQIKAGADPLALLYRLEEFADYWIGQWPELSNLIDRLTIEFDL